jgi:hypothetical protein
VLLVRKVVRVLKASIVYQVLLVLKAWQALKVLRAHKDPLAPKALLVHKVSTVYPVFQALKVSQEHKDHRAHKV